MKRFTGLCLTLILGICIVIPGCGKSQTTENMADTSESKGITLLNIKSEVNDQIEALAAAYTAETGVEVTIICVPPGVDGQSTLKGYYLSDKMPDIIACEASGFDNWEGLLVDMSDQEWVSRTDAAFIDEKYGTLGFPYTTEAIGLIYNKNILDQCGIDPASINGPSAMAQAFETINANKEALGLTAVIAYAAEPEYVGWSTGNHIMGAYLDSGLERDDTTYIDLVNNEQRVDDARFADYAVMVNMFAQYSEPSLLRSGTYDDQVNGFISGKYAFITQGSWIGATMTTSDSYAAAGSFEVGMLPYCFQDGMDTILTSAPSWWAIPKEGNVDEAKAFLQWCSEDAGQKIMVEDAGFISAFTDCTYVASDPFAETISDYIAAGKTSNWHWMDMASGVGNGEGGLCYCFYRHAIGETDSTGFAADINQTLVDWYKKL